ncbi:tripartite tricarboxylate transporter permease [Candidatus Pacearchaeota archaeon]|nr:tripartite tricarboxylate transporter permease [Candidatus Pacearchaeota archaeon]
MLFEVMALALGILVGTLTGLTPGVHINLVAALILSLDIRSPLPFIIFISALSITHLFIDFIPSTFLGAPEEDTVLSVLPAHQLLRMGRGQEAVVLALYGSLVGVVISIAISPIFALMLPFIFNSIQKIIPYILIFISCYFIMREKEFIIALAIFALSGLLGLFAFNLPVREPLLPLLSGLFGISGIVININQKEKLKEQITIPIRDIRLSRKEILFSSFLGTLVGPLCSFLPGIGSGHASIIASEIREHTNRSFLFLNGLINTLVMSLSFVTAYSIQKTRTGSAAAVKQLAHTLTLAHMIIILSSIFVASLMAFLIGIVLSGRFARLFNIIDYKKLNLVTLSILFLVNLIFSNPLGILILATSSALGMYAILSGSKRINLMGCLLIPSIIFYLT